MRFLVIGNALPETIVRSEDGYQRRHIGGVGAIMARELASEGADTAFLTTAPSGAPAEALLQALKLMDLKVAVIPGAPAQKNNSHATITTRLGGPIRAQGSWSIMGGLGKHIAILTPQFDWTLVSLTLRGNDLETVAKSARKLAVNATSKKHVALIPHIQEQAVTTMNQQESGKLMNLMSVREPSDLPSKLGAATLMVTRGARGRTVYQANGERWDAPTVPVPQGADFIGAGDAATAGLVYSQAMGLDMNETVDRFITRLLQRNADAFRKP